MFFIHEVALYWKKKKKNVLCCEHVLHYRQPVHILPVGCGAGILTLTVIITLTLLNPKNNKTMETYLHLTKHMQTSTTWPLLWHHLGGNLWSMLIGCKLPGQDACIGTMGRMVCACPHSAHFDMFIALTLSAYFDTNRTEIECCFVLNNCCMIHKTACVECIIWCRQWV